MDVVSGQRANWTFYRGRVLLLYLAKLPHALVVHPMPARHRGHRLIGRGSKGILANWALFVHSHVATQQGTGNCGGAQAQIQKTTAALPLTRAHALSLMVADELSGNAADDV